ncbi:MAG: SDR family oxidoreductase [Paracoccaceae bacterium]
MSRPSTGWSGSPRWPHSNTPPPVRRDKGGVTVNCIAPGWTETALIQPQIDAAAAAGGGDRDAGIAALLSAKQPSRRMSDPAEIGALARWLCAPVAHNVTGTTIPVDGGWTAQ